MSGGIAQLLAHAAGPAALLDTAPYGGDVAAVVAPATADAAAAVLALCSREGWQVQPCGNGTRPAMLRAARARAAPGTRPVLLSTARMNGVLEHEPADVVVGAAAGIPHEKLRMELAAQRQELPLDPAILPASTVGATVALGAAGPLRAAHGLPRDAVLGVEVVTGDGRILRFGGRVVKNVAGYDGVRLLTGSGGALGLITTLFLRLRALPPADRTLAYSHQTAAHAAAAARGIRDAVAADALELLSPRLASALGLPPQWTLLVRLRGGEAAVADAAGRLAAAAGTGTPVPVTLWAALASLEASPVPADAGALLVARGEPGAAAAHRDVAPSVTHWEATASVAVLPELAEWLNSLPDAYIAVHAADGVARVWGSATNAEDARDAVLARGWSYRSAGTRTVRGASDPGVARIERALQAQFDPAGVLLPRLAVLS